MSDRVLEATELVARETTTGERNVRAELWTEGAHFEVVVWSYKKNDEPWSTPRVSLPSGPTFSHEQWLQISKLVAGLFVEFERRWPTRSLNP